MRSLRLQEVCSKYFNIFQDVQVFCSRPETMEHGFLVGCHRGPWTTGIPGEERVSYQVLKIFKDVSEPSWNFRELPTAFQLSVTKASFINVFAHNFDELWTSDGQSALPKPPGNELGRSVDRSWLTMLTWCPGGVLSFTLDFRPLVWLVFWYYNVSVSDQEPIPGTGAWTLPDWASELDLGPQGRSGKALLHPSPSNPSIFHHVQL